MPTSIIKTNGDYKIQAFQGGRITLDAGASGTITVIGNLDITGNLTAITTINTTITDNILTVNQGESGNGIHAGQAGMAMSRGTNFYGDAYMVFDESQLWPDPVTNTTRNGAFVFKTFAGGLNGIRTTSIGTNGYNLNLINAGNGVISVSGTVNYETHVTDDDHIPNKKYVDDEVTALYNTLRSTEIYTSNDDQSTSTSTGSLHVPGGAGIAKDMFLGGQLNVAGAINTFSNSTVSTTTSTGAVVITGGLGVGGQATINNASITASTASTTTGTGALIVAGGAGISGQATINNASITATTLSTSTTTGALTVAGGVGIAGTATIDSVLVTSNTASTTTSSGALIVNYGVGIGGQATINNVSITANTASTTTGTGALLVTGGVGVSGQLNVGGSTNIFSGGTASTSTTTGTIVVTGGVGVSGQLTVNNLSISANTASTTTSSGALVVTGGVGIGGQATINNISATANTSSTSITTGTVVVTGGVGISQNLYVGGYSELVYQASDPSSDSTGVKIYSKNVDTGVTGIYFINNSTSGELVSKAKALAYSLVFG